MLKPELSVILPVYNAGKYLEKCLDSILGQSYKNLEIIAVNDGSTDVSEQLLKEYAAKDNRLRWWTIQNRGPAYARNYALQMAVGTYIVFCDSDDEVPVSAYQSLILCAEKTQADAVVGRYYDCTDSGDIKLRYRMKKKNATPFSIFYFDQILCNRLYRRSIIENHTIRFPDQPLAEDTIFLTEYFVHCEKIEMISSVVYHYFYHNGNGANSLSHTYTKEFLLHRISGLQRTICILRDYQIAEIEQFTYETAFPSIFDLFRKVTQLEDKLSGYEMVTDFVRGCAWDEMWKREAVERIAGMPVEEFLAMSAEEYLCLRASADWKDAVLRQFEQGQIGFRYIIKYLYAWAQYKRKRHVSPHSERKHLD